MPLFSKTKNRFFKKQKLRAGTLGMINLLQTIVLTLQVAKMPDFQRLPKTVIPNHYDLKLKPNLENFSFEGTVSIHVEIISATNEIVFNSIELDIKDAFLLVINKHYKPSNIILSVENETASLTFNETLPVGKATLNIEYTGHINDKLKGLYRSKYTNARGEVKYAAVTQFAPIDARRCFPCWDEPEIKATFAVTLTVPNDRVALSNMPVVSTISDIENKKVVKFDTTPIMSTYLLAVVVGEFDYIEAVSDETVLVRVYTPIGKKEQGRFALEVATRALVYYKEYFKIAYPLPKMDLIAVADFAFGAMENWGLVIYRELQLLVDSENSSALSKQAISLVVCHELAHQWFGNLVTMEWWTDVWLNEGYASFMEFLCVDHLFPDYDIWTQFLTKHYIKALELDRLDSSHPIEIPVKHPSELDEIFDDISYSKGASVIRMLHHYIGDSDFRKGMNIYLTRHQYNNTKTKDLWSALEEASQKPVGVVMSTWTNQMGFPVIQVNFQKDNGKKVMELTQGKYHADGGEGSDNALWMVPIAICTQENPDKEALSIILENKTQSVVLENIGDSWVKLNPGTIGFYRTSYPEIELAQLIMAIRSNQLPPLDRLGLLDDNFALVQAGHKSSVDILKLIQAFVDETNFTVWSTISNCLSKLRKNFYSPETNGLLKNFGRNLFLKIYKNLGWETQPNEIHITTLLRSLVIENMVISEDPDALNEAINRYDMHMNGGKTIPADLRSVCYRAALTKPGPNIRETLTQLLELYKATDLHEEKQRISSAMGAIKDPDIIFTVLQFTISENVRLQDAIYFMSSVASSQEGTQIAWQFFKDNWIHFSEKYKGNVLLGRIVKGITENFSMKDYSVDIKDFFEDHPTPGTERAVQQSTETILLNAAWLERDEESINAYLNNSSFRTDKI